MVEKTTSNQAIGSAGRGRGADRRGRRAARYHRADATRPPLPKRSPASSSRRTTSPPRPGAGTPFTARLSPGPFRPELIAGARRSRPVKAGRSTGGSCGPRRCCTTSASRRSLGMRRASRSRGRRSRRRFLERPRAAGETRPSAWRGRSCSTCSRRSRWTTASRPSCSIVRPGSTFAAPGSSSSTPSGRRRARLPAGAFDRQFLAAIAREAAVRPTCQSARLLHATGLAAWMARSPWRDADDGAITIPEMTGERSRSTASRAETRGRISAVTMTASRYSLGTTIVPSSARLNRAMRSSRSASRAARPASPTASNAFSVGP